LFDRLRGYVVAPLALQFAYCVAWRKVGTAGAIKEIWSEVAHATRYGRATLSEALTMDRYHLSHFLGAVNDIVSAENGAGAGLREK
jgi:hypothetical protein